MHAKLRYLVTVKFDYIIDTSETIAEVNERMTRRIKDEYNPRKMLMLIDEEEFALKREERKQANNHNHNHHHHDDDEEGCCPE